MNTENLVAEIIPAEDKEFIREMVTLPKESKILARGIILGLGLAAQPSQQQTST